MRDTCLHCEQNGTETPLVDIGHPTWRFCPIHSAEYLQQVQPPTFLGLLEAAGIAPQLKDKGIRRA